MRMWTCKPPHRQHATFIYIRERASLGLVFETLKCVLIFAKKMKLYRKRKCVLIFALFVTARAVSSTARRLSGRVRARSVPRARGLDCAAPGVCGPPRINKIL